ncbi:MAG: MATE family efflux transporter [Desulfamplus sp.]|nr:MATE family efflux transporter [Desulfamplus sp.]
MRYKLNFNNYKEVINVSLPMVLSMGSITLMEFTDRIFLANYSLDALAAATPAGITAFLFNSFFMGVAGYVNVFIAQYIGVNNRKGVGASLWQGIYFAIFGAIFMLLLSIAANPIFSMIDHAPEIQQLEVIYFRIICLGSGIILIASTLSCFYSGRGFTKTVMVIHIAGTLFNIPLGYALINGRWGFPELGIKGAAIATISSWILIASIFGILIFNKKNNERFHVFSKMAFDPELFIRLMKYGIPGGTQFFLDILVFTFFVLMIGRVGTTELTVTNLVLSINGLSYMPMWGFSIGVSTLVGQAMGKNMPDDAVLAVRSTAHIALVYVCCLIVIFILTPEPLIHLFLPDNLTIAEKEPLILMGSMLLRFVAIYLLFDSLIIIYTGALKGAGDSRFIMLSIISASILFIFIPLWFGISRFGMGLYFAWSCITLYLMVLFIMVITRYNNGKWKEIRILEH